MKRTIKNLAKLLKEQTINLRGCQDTFTKEGKHNIAENFKHRRWILEDVIRLLEDKTYFDDMCEIFEIGEE